MALRTLSVCAGVGGLDLGVRSARPDARCVAFVEREASAAASLVASMAAGRLHPAAIWSDLRTFDAGAWRGAVDCVLSGDPCQGNSVAGKRLGEADDRWLLDRAIDVFDQSGAHTFFRENVPGNLAGQLAAAIPALERLGCRITAGIFSAAEAGASHRRERFFILAHRPMQRSGEAGQLLERSSQRLAGCCGTLVHTPSIGRREGRPKHELRGGRDAATHTGSALAVADGSRSQGRRGRSDPCRRQEPDGHARLGGRGLDLPAFAPGPADPRWPDIIARAPSLEPAVRRVADGLAGRIERLRHCGNGVVPLAAALAWVRLHGLLDGDATGIAFVPADDRTAEAAEPVLRAA